MESTCEPGRVTLYWRPGCPYCFFLRRGLRRAGVAMTEVNIAKDPRAAARLRGLTGGDETVPTVVVRESCLVNPSVAAVLAALDPP